jgi:hypothetical protein
MKELSFVIKFQLFTDVCVIMNTRISDGFKTRKTLL